MDQICKFCKAKKFKGETPGMCCASGKVVLPELQELPQPLQRLMTNETANSKTFLKNIRKFNNCFQMTSFGTTQKYPVTPGFNPTFKIQGQVYHRTGSLLPMGNEQPKFLQIYFMGNEQNEVDQRILNNPGMERTILLELQRMLHQENNYVKSFKTALEHMPRDDMKIVIRADKTPSGEHERRFNAPVFDEVAIVIEGNQFERRDIILKKRDNQLQKISEIHRSYDPLQYPIMFPRGEDGYWTTIKQVDPITKVEMPNKNVSAMNFYGYKIMVRDNENHILNCRELFHQYLVDMYAKIESERLAYIRFNQSALRTTEYCELRDAVLSDGVANNLGKLVILPSTFAGGPRYMHEYIQDAMTYVRIYGTPDLFITFTCNPKWKEISCELPPHQNKTNRHDIIARVFRRKLTKLIGIITKGKIYGKVNCWMYSIEWQKRGLPHAHILIWLKHKIQPNEIDRIISSELPNKHHDPFLFEIIENNMLHGPCGTINPNSPCMKNDKCTKRYPRQLVSETQTAADGYPLYRRRSPEDGGFMTTKSVKRDNQTVTIDIDNRWVVPYCPLLSKIFEAHINVEYCNSVKSIKYICKYVNKGCDQAVFRVQNDEESIDEIDNFRSGRYISSNEAAWRILDFPIHERYPTVTHLSVHLENGQRVFFNDNNIHQKATEPPRTTLTAFFELCQTDDFAKTLLYCDVPKYYTWNKSTKKFSRRIQGEVVPGHPGVVSSDALGRVYTVHPNNHECFFLRMLLHAVKGPTSFDHLRTFDGQVCETYRKACQKRRLLEDDNHWDDTMREAAQSDSPAKIRYLFAILITTCGVSNPMELWTNYKEKMSEDVIYHARQNNPSLEIDFNIEIFNQTLILIEDKVLQMVGKSLQDLGLPNPTRKVSENFTNMHSIGFQRDFLRETSYNTKDLESYVEENHPLLVADQKIAYDAILNRIASNTGELFFLDAPGGTGKTFVINLLLAEVRRRKQIAIAIASSGIAATLLQGGRTAHSTLKLPLDLVHSENPVCNISKGTGPAKVLEECKLIVWDECTMMHKNGLEALSRTLQDIRGNSDIMGGVVVVLAGDFRQILPVIPRGTMTDEINACLKKSPLWEYVTTFKLTTNMRVHLQQIISDGCFADQLIQLGNGRLAYEPNTDTITLPIGFCNVVETIEDLQQSVFPNITTNFRNHQWLCERAILAPKNECVHEINFQIQEKLPGEATTYKSIDTVTNTDEAVLYPIEFLNSLNPSGMPLHNIKIKEGSIIMLLRNLDAPRLCNGTRLCIKLLQPNTIKATILTGCAKGEEVLIPRIPLISTDTPIHFKRLQFPIRLAYAMTINKAQGQTLQIAGIDLRTDCFTHGQLYVAASRVGSANNLYILSPDRKTRNIVYQEAIK